MTDQKRVLFLCRGNSCRSQLAEGIVNHFLGEQWMAFSAGTEPAGYVHPLAIKALAEIGITHTGFSKPVETFWGEPLDLVVTVCDGAAETCPVWLGSGKKAHINFPDPSLVTGTDEEIMDAFRQVRDYIRAEVILYLMAFPANELQTMDQR